MSNKITRGYIVWLASSQLVRVWFYRGEKRRWYLRPYERCAGLFDTLAGVPHRISNYHGHEVGTWEVRE